MASLRSKTLFLTAFLMLVSATLASSKNLSPKFYDKICPKALPTIKRIVEDAVRRERRMGGSILRLHFHDCFVNGCDGSVLLDSSSTIDSEKDANANQNSARGFEVIDRIKEEVDKVCRHSVVSCADILTVASRDSVVALGGPSWKVPLGRRDSTTASRSDANRDIPSPFMDLRALINNFRRQGLNQGDLVALSGGHTLGFAQCFTFRSRIHNDTNIDQSFARQRRRTCPQSGSNSNLAPLDRTPARFDTAYFSDLVNRRGLLESDQALFNGGSTDRLVRYYSHNSKAFDRDFVKSMIKMGNIGVLTGKRGEIRRDCRRVN